VVRTQREIYVDGSAANLADGSLTALKWNYASVGGKIVIQLVVGVVLARLLGPGPFGVYTAVLLVGGTGGLLVERGFDAALVTV
jgi:O-antigen/teichoic acid export membrane protein